MQKRRRDSAGVAWQGMRGGAACAPRKRGAGPPPEAQRMHPLWLTFRSAALEARYAHWHSAYHCWVRPTLRSVVKGCWGFGAHSVRSTAAGTPRAVSHKGGMRMPAPGVPLLGVACISQTI